MMKTNNTKMKNIKMKIPMKLSNKNHKIKDNFKEIIMLMKHHIPNLSQNKKD